MNDHSLMLTGMFIGALTVPVVVLFMRMTRVVVHDGEALVITRFGKLAATLTTPGWHWLPDRLAPYLQVHRVSLKRDFLPFEGIRVTDKNGTTVVVEIFLELRVVDPVKALFAVDDRHAALKNLIAHAVAALLAERAWRDILSDRDGLSTELRSELADELERWGVRLEHVAIRDLALLPDVSAQVFRTVAARLMRAKARVEEDGRQRVALLEAQTSEQVATLVADARGQYPAAVGRAYSVLRKRPGVFEAYRALYELSLVRPNRTVAFRGFNGTLNEIDAAEMAAGGTS
jgi:regulator of protease activity HflC (stomatin/prohibitin superfamily)